MRDVKTLELIFVNDEDGIVLVLPNHNRSVVYEDGVLKMYFSETAGIAIAQHLAEEYGLIAVTTKDLQ